VPFTVVVSSNRFVNNRFQRPAISVSSAVSFRLGTGPCLGQLQKRKMLTDQQIRRVLEAY
jgi:hypothetical protein